MSHCPEKWGLCLTHLCNSAANAALELGEHPISLLNDYSLSNLSYPDSLEFYLGVFIGVGGESNGTPLQYSCLEKSHGWRSLVGCSPWGRS